MECSFDPFAVSERHLPVDSHSRTAASICRKTQNPERGGCSRAAIGLKIADQLAARYSGFSPALAFENRQRPVRSVSQQLCTYKRTGFWAEMCGTDF